MKQILLIFTVLMSLSADPGADFYALSFKTIRGETYSFEQLRGKKVLIVNTASNCGYTPQFKELEALHKEYGPGLVI